MTREQPAFNGIFAGARRFLLLFRGLLSIIGPATGDWMTQALLTTLKHLLKKRFGHAAFRPNQEEVCLAVAQGYDTVVVMPTGSGKSLCYQIPGLARGGTTLVISPLIALMDDQATKLTERGIRAESLHSGRSRDEQRATCIRYIKGELDFLMVAPERLSLPGFVEFLERRKPGLVAIDEAHCISHWGHDFRLDYRLLGDHLPRLRPAPLVAMTATATVRVQNDIATQLKMNDPAMFIRGFRRDNLAIECKEIPRSQRPDFVKGLLAPAESRPAIVYVPTRKEAEELSAGLPKTWKPVFYHAGASVQDRCAAQTAFMDGDASVVVATVAFGMGIDKSNIRTVVHTALPQSVEQYYQEVGRAGRDGKASRAILLFSQADKRLLESFHARSYPDVSLLETTLKAFKDEPLDREHLAPTGHIPEEQLTEILRQLSTHGALVAEPDGRYRKVTGGRARTWKRTYIEQSHHRLGQMEDVLAFAQASGCRMNRLVGYFSREEGKEAACGLCDRCAPGESISHHYRKPTAMERLWAREILAALRHRDGRSAGKLHKELFSSTSPTRDEYDRLVSSMARAGLLLESEDLFEREGYQIAYTRVHLTGVGRSLMPDLDSIQMDGVSANEIGPVGPTPKPPIPKRPPRRKPLRW